MNFEMKRSDAFLVLLSVILALLKLANITTIDWVWVVAPVWATLLLVIVVGLLGALLTRGKITFS